MPDIDFSESGSTIATLAGLLRGQAALARGIEGLQSISIELDYIADRMDEVASPPMQIAPKFQKVAA